MAYMDYEILMFAEYTDNWMYGCSNVLDFEHIKPRVFKRKAKQFLHEAPFCSHLSVLPTNNPLFPEEGTIFSKIENRNISTKLNYIKFKHGFLSLNTDQEFPKGNLKTSLYGKLIGTFACRTFTMTEVAKMGRHFRS